MFFLIFEATGRISKQLIELGFLDPLPRVSGLNNIISLTTTAVYSIVGIVGQGVRNFSTPPPPGEPDVL